MQMSNLLVCDDTGRDHITRHVRQDEEGLFRSRALPRGKKVGCARLHSYKLEASWPSTGHAGAHETATWS